MRNNIAIQIRQPAVVGGHNGRCRLRPVHALTQQLTQLLLLAAAVRALTLKLTHHTAHIDQRISLHINAFLGVTR